MNDERMETDPHGLLTSGQQLAPLPELARVLGVSGTALRSLLRGALHGKVRFARSAPGAWLYCVADAQVAIEPHRIAIEARRQRAVELEQRDRAARAARVAAQQPPRTPHVPPLKLTPKPAPVQGRAAPAAPSSGPEVFVRRRRGADAATTPGRR